MNILFLDFDGIFVFLDIVRQYKLEVNAGIMQWLERYYSTEEILTINIKDLMIFVIGCNENYLKNIIRYCRDTNSKIVITSSWGNHRSLNELKTIVKIYDGLEKLIIDKVNSKNRVTEVERYLKRNNVDFFLIVDDKNEFNKRLFSKVFSRNFLLCEQGFTDDFLRRAMRKYEINNMSSQDKNILIKN